MMDLNLMRSLLTLLLFVGFITMTVLIIMRGRGAYDQAANLPFVENEGSQSDE